MSGLKKITILLIIVPALFSCVTKKLPDNLSMDKWAELYIKQSVEQGKLDGGICAMIYSKGDALYSGGYGMADAKSGWAVDSETPMPVGSLSKIFTSVAVMTMVEDGKINLDEAVGVYLPKLKLERGMEMHFTVRDLLTHHSGIPGDLFADWFDSDKENLYELMKDRPMAAEPGKLFSYANTGFTLLGLIIEERSGLSYDEYIKREIFEPAGMTHSYVHPAEAAEPLPRGYNGKSDISVPRIRDYPAGGFIISADDMGRFIHALYGNDETLLRNKTLSEMLSVQNAGNAVDRNFRIGLGFWLIDPFMTGELMASHGGDLPPYHSILVTMPDRDLAVFVSTNDNGKDGSVAMKAGLAIMEELLDREGVARGDSSPGEIVPMSAEEMEPYRGTYGTMAGLIELEPGRNHLQMTLGKMKLRLNLMENGRYRVEFRLLNLIPISIPQLASLEIDLYETGDDHWLGLWMNGVYMGTGSKLKDVSYGPEYDALIGSYMTPGGVNILEDGSAAVSDVEITKKSGRYIMKLKLLGQNLEMALRPVAKGRALTDGTGRGMGDLLIFNKNSDGKIILGWSGFTLEKED